MPAVQLADLPRRQFAWVVLAAQLVRTACAAPCRQCRTRPFDLGGLSTAAGRRLGDGTTPTQAEGKHHGGDDQEKSNCGADTSARSSPGAQAAAAASASSITPSAIGV